MLIARFAFAAVFMSTTTAAVSDTLDHRQLLEILSEPEAHPSVIAVASGFGASAGQVFATVSYTDKDQQTKRDGDDDGSIALGFGFGDPDKSVGFELAIGITSVSSPWWGDGKFGDEGNTNIKVHRRFNPTILNGTSSASFGISNLWGWGGTKEIPQNLYLAYTEQGYFGRFNEYGASITAGYGTNVANGENDSSFFGGIAVARSQINTSISFIGDEIYYSGSFHPVIYPNLSITYSRAVPAGNISSGRNILSLGHSFVIGG